MTLFNELNDKLNSIPILDAWSVIFQSLSDLHPRSKKYIILRSIDRSFTGLKFYHFRIKLFETLKNEEYIQYFNKRIIPNNNIYDDKNWLEEEKVYEYVWSRKDNSKVFSQLFNTYVRQSDKVFHLHQINTLYPNTYSIISPMHSRNKLVRTVMTSKEINKTNKEIDGLTKKLIKIISNNE